MTGAAACPVHGPGCYGIPEECAWIEADIARRQREALDYAEQERAYWREQETAYHAEVDWDCGNARGLA